MMLFYSTLFIIFRTFAWLLMEVALRPLWTFILFGHSDFDVAFGFYYSDIKDMLNIISVCEQ